MAKFIKFNCWNKYSRRFVKPPQFSWEPVEDAVKYRIGIGGVSQRQATWFETNAASFDLSAIWDSLPFGHIDMLILPLNQQGREVDMPWYEDNMAHKTFIKSSGWKGGKHTPLDWEKAVKTNMEFLLRPASDIVDPFEEGLPRHVWSATEDAYTGERHFGGHPGRINSYPALHFPLYISAFLNYAMEFPEDPLSSEAKRQALQYGEWLLNNHHPYDYVCSGFPFSCVRGGILEEHSPTGRNNVTVFRVAAVGEAMLQLGKTLGKDEYGRYALRIADGLVKLQREDGSWPFRVDPKTGQVIAEYTSDVVTPARFMALLYIETSENKYKDARDKAMEWMFKNPISTYRWEGMYEDVAEVKPYSNLQHWDVNETIRYLAYFSSEIEDALPTAKKLNEYIEDLFVIWETGDSAINVQCPTPLVCEQFMCYAPMEAHTGTWVLSLIALHAATGGSEYLDKAVAAANAICRGQHDQGPFSTWGYDERFERPLHKNNWLGCNALAVKALIKLNSYVKSVEKRKPIALNLCEC